MGDGILEVSKPVVREGDDIALRRQVRRARQHAREPDPRERSTWLGRSLPVDHWNGMGRRSAKAIAPAVLHEIRPCPRVGDDVTPAKRKVNRGESGMIL